MMAMAVGILGVFAAIPLGHLLHEATHYLTARLLLVPARIDFALPLAVDYKTGSPARAVLVDIAPSTVGVLTGALWLYYNGIPAVSLSGIAALIGWVTYSTPSKADRTSG